MEMAGMAGLLEVAALAGAMLAAITWLVVVLFAPRAGAGRRQVPPARRMFVARAWLYAPLWVPALLIAAAMMPGVVAALAQSGDHCLAHGGHHHHLCLLHPPHVAESAVAWLIPLGLLVPVVAVVTLCARRVRTEWRLARTLVGASGPSELGPDVRVLDQSEPLALTVGWRRTTILLSRGLLAGVTPQALAVVLAHERAHVARGDTWGALFDRFAGALFPRSVAGPLLAQTTLAREQACDAIAAARVGSPIDVARALTEFMRLGMKAPAVGVSVASGGVEARVVQLLRPPRRGRWWPAAFAAFALVLVVAGAGPVHSAVERLITTLLH